MKLSSLAGFCLPAILMSSASLCQADGLTLGATRLIYDATKKEASVPLRNEGKSVPYLVQAWISDIDRKTDNIPFIATPPLFKLSQNSDSNVRVVYVQTSNSLPSDRESLFLLNVRAIPAVEKNDAPQRIIIATQNIIKMIYRPAGLNSKEAGLAGQKLNVSTVSGGVSINNPTPYVVTLTAMTVNGKKIEHSGNLLPHASMTIPVGNVAVHSVTFNTINDFGGLDTPRKVNF